MDRSIPSTSNNTSPKTYTIIFLEDKVKNKESVVRILVEVLNLSQVDGKLIVKNICGYINKGLTLEEATSISKRLKDLQIESQVVQISDIPFLPPPKDLIELDFSPNSLIVKTTSQKNEEIRTDNIICAIGGFIFQDPLSFYTSDYFTKLPVFYKLDDKEARKKLREKVVSRADEKDLSGFKKDSYSVQDVLNNKSGVSKLIGVVDLIVISPPGRFRIASNNFIAYSKIIPQVSKNNLSNFRMLAKVVIEKLPSSCDSKLARTVFFETGSNISTFDTTSQLDDYERWYLYTNHKNLPAEFFDKKIAKFSINNGRQILESSKVEIKKGKRLSWAVIIILMFFGISIICGVGFWVYTTKTKKIFEDMKKIEALKEEGKKKFSQAKEKLLTDKLSADVILEDIIRRYNKELLEVYVLKNRINRMLYNIYEPREHEKIRMFNYENRTVFENLIVVEEEPPGIYYKFKELDRKIHAEMCLEIFLSYIHLKNREKSQEYFAELKNVLNNDFSNPTLRIAEGYNCLSDEKYDGALNCFLQLSEGDITTDVRIGIAISYEELGNLDKAIDILKKTLEVEPDLPAVKLRLANLFLKKEDLKTAKEYAEGVFQNQNYYHLTQNEEFKEIFIKVGLIVEEKKDEGQ